MEVSAMIDLTRNRRKIFAFTGLFVLLLAAVLLLLPPEISPALGGGVGLEYRIHAVFNDEEEQQLAESSLIQTASDTLGLPVEGSLVPSAAQENLWLLQLRLDPTDEIPYDDFQDLTYALINSFPGWTFQTTAGISQSRGTAVRSTVDYLLCLIVLLGISALYLLLRCRRLQSSPAAAAGMLGILFSLLGMCALSALVGVVFDFSTILAALSLVVFAVYDITAIFAAMERHPADSAADWAMALRAAQRERGRGLMVNTLVVSAVLLSITVGAYHSDMTALTAFSFPLTAGLAFALYAGLVLTPLLWYEFRFGRDSRTEPDSAE